MMNSKKAYTLAELLVSLAIFTVVIGSLMSILISQNAFFSRASAAVDVGGKARRVMTLMVKELRLAKQEVVNVYDRPLDQPGVSLDHTNGKSIVFQFPVDWDGDGDKFDEWGRIEWGCEGGLDWSIEYYYDSVNQRVMRRVWDAANTAQSETVVAEDISNFLIQGFQYDSSLQTYILHSACEIIEINITAQRDSISGRTLDSPLTYSLINRVTWRNN
ncbi:MAG: type II secretion system protein [Candidatus Omnitrophota bacterium]